MCVCGENRLTKIILHASVCVTENLHSHGGIKVLSFYGLKRNEKREIRDIHKDVFLPSVGHPFNRLAILLS